MNHWRPLFTLLLTLTLLLPHPLNTASLKNYTIDQVFFHLDNNRSIATPLLRQYYRLLHLKPGDKFNYSAVRKSIATLYHLGTFNNIEVSFQEKSLITSSPNQKKGQRISPHLDLHFIFSPKLTIHKVNVNQIFKDLKDSPRSFKTNDFLNAIYSIREKTYFQDHLLPKAKKEALAFMKSRGYFNPTIQYSISKNRRDCSVTVSFSIETGPITRIKQIDLTITHPELGKDIRQLLDTSYYIPAQFASRIENVKKYLWKHNYLSPEITVTENFLPGFPGQVILTITVNPGFQYQFKFIGIKDKLPLISSLWKKKVFEEWAKQESQRRILLWLRNKGYLSADVQAKITTLNGVKTITFKVDKKRKYRLGRIFFQGNQSVSEKTLRTIIQVDDLIFEKFFHLRLQPLVVDREIVQLYYYFQGYPSARVLTEPKFLGNKADIYFIIDEGNRYSIESLLFEGNRFFTSQFLTSQFQTHVNGPFVQQKLNEDLEKIRTLYHMNGFDKIDVDAEISPGTEKSILVRIREGAPFQMGTLITIGASRDQRKLIEHRFPLKLNQPFDQLKVEKFQTEMNNSGIFSKFDLSKIERENNTIDVLINLTPDKTRFYGFGIGLLEREHFRDFQIRGTFEYQDRNFLGSYSNFSAMLQWSPQEKRGLLSYDTPFFFKTPIKSSLRVWADNEIFSSYSFDRYGISQTLVKEISHTASLSVSISWYRTTLTSLEITSLDHPIDNQNDPFDTTAINLSYINENRDDPFNPTEGNFFTSYVKMGFPVFRNYFFAKLWWGFQQNYKFLKQGIATFSIRNGLASDDISITERFFAGGFNTFRGAWTDRLGPRDLITGKPSGGRSFLLLNIETTFPISILPINDLYYSIFADIGNVYKNVHDFNFKQLRSALGLSLKYKTPLGPLRFDLGWDLGTGVPRLHIGIGNML